MKETIPLNAISVKAKTPTALFFENQILKPAIAKQQRLQNTHAAEPPPLPVNPEPVPKSNRKWVVPTIIFLFTAGVLIVGYINSTSNKEDHERRKI